MPGYFFVFLVETVFYYVGQAGLELLASGDPPASASQSARITGVSHLARHINCLFNHEVSGKSPLVFLLDLYNFIDFERTDIFMSLPIHKNSYVSIYLCI